jgi:rod shape-determining protein MreC
VLDIRRRTGVLLFVVTMGHIFLISVQVQSKSGVPVLQAATFGIFARVQGGTASVIHGVRNFWGNYVGLRGVRAENETLRRQLGEIQVQFQQEHAKAERTRQLERLLGFRHEIQIDTVPSGVIGAGASLDFRTLTIDKGTKAGLAKNMAVIAPTGVVGRIVTPTANAAKVQLLIDRNAAAGALVERSRAQGVVLGAGEELLRMDFVASTADVRTGDTIVTSGIDGIYPKGFVIGTVERVGPGNGIYKAIRVRPSVDFNRLEDVLVVTSPPPRMPADEGPS